MTGIYNNQQLLASFASDGQLMNDDLQPPAGMGRLRLCNLSSMTDPVANCPSSLDEWVLDGPAGIPQPDGGLQYPPAPPPQQQVPVSSGPNLVEMEPGVYRVLAQRLPPELSNAIQFQMPVGQAPPPPPVVLPGAG